MKAIFAVFATAICLTCSAGNLELVKNGISSYRIVIDPNANLTVRKAANELKQYLHKSTGASLAVVKAETTSGKPSIVIGPGKAATAAGIDAKDLPPEGFTARTVGKNLYIAGDDSKGDPVSTHWRSSPKTGTWYGVCDFLEKYLDIRWFSPGKYGEHVPKKQNLVIPEINYTESPGMELRLSSFWWGGKLDRKRRKQYREWQRRNRYGRSQIWCSWHTWTVNFKASDYFDKHPEWFALVDGIRLKNTPLGAKMCVTNQQALDKFAEIIINKRKGKEAQKIMFSLSPNDGGGHCQCAKCQALDNGIRKDGSRIMTDRYVYYCNEIAKRVKKVLPDQKFGFLAYSYYADPPEKFSVDPNVCVMLVGNCIQLGYRQPGAARKELNEMMLPWKAKQKTLYLDSYTVGNGLLNLPSTHPSVIRTMFQNIVKAQISGATFWNYAPPLAAGLDSYMYLRMMWNPKADFNKVYADAMAKCYGAKAAQYVNQYFDYVEAAGNQAAKSIVKNRALGLLRIDNYIPLFAGSLKKIGPVLEKAISLADTPNQKFRIQALLDNLKYADMTSSLYILGKDLISGKNVTASRLVQAIKLAEERREFMRELDRKYWFNLNKVLKNEKAFRIPLDPAIYQAMYRESGNPAVAQIPKMRRAPRPDGRLETSEWKDASVLEINRKNVSGTPVQVPTRVMLGRKDNNLYVCFICREPDTTNLHDVIKRRDGNVWKDNDVEIFLAPKGVKGPYFQLMVNSLGTLSDYRFSSPESGEKKWNSGAVVAAGKEKEQWIVEISIPLKSISGKGFRPGDIWMANFCRNRKISGNRELSAWNPTFAGFHRPERFGKIIFR